jgi:23S rRNA pseudouridine2605 synthase
MSKSWYKDRMYLAKFLAQQGICARRKAALLIKAGKICIDGIVIYNPAYLVSETDTVIYQNKSFQLGKNTNPLHYVLFNKPPKLVTTTNDEFGRKSVIDYLQEHGITQTLFPVGRLDYLTTGLLLLTNDGDFAYRMSHPKFEIVKRYQVTLNRLFQPQDLKLLKQGIMLSDGFIQPDNLRILSQQKNFLVEISIHSGRNRIVRRIFNALGYNILELKRTSIGPFSLGTLAVGAWKFLDKKAIEQMLTTS